MSIISISTGEPTCTLEDLHAAAKANNFSIEPGSDNEKTYLLFANSFDAVCNSIEGLPDYEDPRLKPLAVEGGEREFYRPTQAENPLNAWMYRTRLRAADERAQRGPLAGRTVAVKDNMSVGGLPTGLGTAEALFRGGKHPISPIDATVVRRVLEAGGVIIGTGTCENLSISSVSYTSAAGPVHNAWLPGYATGGSSSGCGSLLSIADVEEARKSGKVTTDHPLGEGVELALGGDQGGSVRLPAAYSGFYGLKPTYGLVPYTGVAPLLPLIDHVGPMARTVEDIAILLGVLAGYDGIDPRMTPETPLRSQVHDYIGDLTSWVTEKEEKKQWNVSQAAAGIRIGVLREAFQITPLDPSVAATLDRAIERFESLGADVQEISVPLHSHGGAIWTVATRSLIPNVLAAKPSDQLGYTLPHIDPSPIGQEFYDKLANKNPAPINVLMNAVQMEQKHGSRLARKSYTHIFQLRAAYDEALKDVDVLLTPMTPTVGPKIPTSTFKTPENAEGRSERIMDLYEGIMGNTLNTCPFNLTGHPALSVPVGWGKTTDGVGRLPVGMQIVAKKWEESMLLKAAKAWEVGGKWMDA